MKSPHSSASQPHADHCDSLGAALHQYPWECTCGVTTPRDRRVLNPDEIDSLLGIGDTTVKSTGGPTIYYDFPEGATTLMDLIEHREMSFALGNIFKACYRLGRKSGSDALYDIRKMEYFIQRLKAQYERDEHGA